MTIFIPMWIIYGLAIATATAAWIILTALAAIHFATNGKRKVSMFMIAVNPVLIVMCVWTYFFDRTPFYMWTIKPALKATYAYCDRNNIKLKTRRVNKTRSEREYLYYLCRWGEDWK